MFVYCHFNAVFLLSAMLISGVMGVIIHTGICQIPKYMQHQEQKTKPSTPHYFSRDFLHLKCTHCKSQAWQLWLVIGLSVTLTLLIIGHFDLHWKTLAYLILTWSLLLLAGIDIKYYLLPDCLTLPLLWLGLIGNSFTLFISPAEAIYGAVAGYVSLWLVAMLFQYFRKLEGIGRGDVKLLAMFGAWWGVSPLPYIVLFASVLGSIAGIIQLLRHGRAGLYKPLPFGPYLALGGLITLFLRS